MLKVLWLLAVAQFFAAVPPVFGQSVVRDATGEEVLDRETVVLPYPLYWPSIDFAVGVLWSVSRYPREQSRLFATAFGSTNSSYGIGFAAAELQPPVFERLFLSPRFLVGEYDETEDAWAEIECRYLLPLGAGRDEVVHTFRVDRGLLVEGETGGEIWNPPESGRTFIGLTPFYRSQQLEIVPGAGKEEFNTNAVEFFLEHDNTDFFMNPSKGSRQRLGVTRDFGFGDSSDSWTVLEGELSKYISLGASDLFLQRVIALNFWTADTPTWEVEDGIVKHRPPYYTGATLGGMHRMRGFARHEFHDKAAVYYGAELRLIPNWNPLRDIGFLQKLEIQWLQFVTFVEVGNVADTWSLSELHDDMNWDAGVGIRAMIRKMVGRVDVGFSDDEWAVYAMVGHPF